MKKSARRTRIEYKSLTAERWNDIEMLFGERGACGGCWCMWWRLKRSEFNTRKGEKNRRSFRRIVRSNAVPGLVAYEDGIPVGWCAIEPRENYPLLESSRVLKRIDDQPVWSITCLFVDKHSRHKGLSSGLIREAVRYAKSQGAKIVEGYPVDSRGKNAPAAFVWTGLVSSFIKAGFKEVARRSATRPIMRHQVR